MRRWALHAVQMTAASPVLGLVVVVVLLGRHRVTFGGPPPHTVAAAGFEVAYPAANVAAALLLAIAALGALVLARAVRFAVVDVRAYRQVLASLSIVGRHGGAYVFRAARPHAFCGGLLRPRVFVSTAAIRALGSAELAAVVAHEARHRRARDPLRLLVARVAARAALPVRLCEIAADRFAVVAELDADRAAVAASGGDCGPLAGALLVLGGTQVDPERVDVLTGRHPDLRLPSGLLVASMAGVAALCGGLWFALHTARFAASLALPGLSAKPCVLVLSMVPLTVALLARTAVTRFRRTGRQTHSGSSGLPVTGSIPEKTSS